MCKYKNTGDVCIKRQISDQSTSMVEGKLYVLLFVMEEH